MKHHPKHEPGYRAQTGRLRLARLEAFSLVEVVMALVVAAAIASVAITYYGEYEDNGLRAAVRQDLDTIRRAIEMYEAQNKREWLSPDPPPVGLSGGKQGRPSRDHWGNPYRVNFNEKKVYSFGPDGIDDEGSGDDISLSYHGLDSGHTMMAPLNLRLADRGPPPRLTWFPPPEAAGLDGYRVEKRSERSGSWTAASDELVAPSANPQFTDDNPGEGITYYRVLAVGKSGQAGPPSNMVGWSPPSAGPPGLTVDPLSPLVAKGGSITFQVDVRSHGSPLDELTFDGESYDLTGTAATIRITRVFNTSGKFAVTARDRSGLATKIDVSVTVKE